MSTQAELPKGHPMRDAWEAYTATDSHRNARAWAIYENHVDGSLWAAFIAGFAAAPPAEAPGERGDVDAWALTAALDWITHAPHGDNCYLSDHYDGDPGNRCNCGKEGTLELLNEAMAAAPAAPAEGDAVARVIFTNRKKPDVEWLTDTVTRDTLLYTAPRVTGGRDSERMDFVEMSCLLCLDSVSGQPGGNGQRMVAATRKNIDAALQAATGGEVDHA